MVNFFHNKSLVNIIKQVNTGCVCTRDKQYISHMQTLLNQKACIGKKISLMAVLHWQVHQTTQKQAASLALLFVCLFNLPSSLQPIIAPTAPGFHVKMLTIFLPHGNMALVWDSYYDRCWQLAPSTQVSPPPLKNPNSANPLSTETIPPTHPPTPATTSDTNHKELIIIQFLPYLYLIDTDIYLYETTKT